MKNEKDNIKRTKEEDNQVCERKSTTNFQEVLHHITVRLA